MSSLLYRYDQAVLELNQCRAKLNRCKGHISALIESNKKMKRIIAEEMPAYRKPAASLRHAARYLRAQKGFRTGRAVTLLFSKALEVEAEETLPYRIEAAKRALDAGIPLRGSLKGLVG